MRVAPTIGYPSFVPALFRRKSANLVEDAVATSTPEEETAAARSRSYTPAKGRETPKRPTAGRRPPGAVTPLTKDEARAQRRAARAEAQAEVRREGTARDRGPERGLARDLVDSRRSVGTWFFGGALIVLLGSGPSMPAVVRFASNLLWVLLAVAVVVDSVLISRKLKKLIKERYPKSTERLGSLYFYAIMRAISFRRMRTPTPRVNVGDPI